MAAVSRRWGADLGVGRVAVVGVGRGSAGAARLSVGDPRIGFVAALDPPSPLRVRPGVHLLQVQSDATAERRRNRWGQWRAELPGVLGWLRAQGFGATSSSAG